jgi:hypothetical protein
VIFEAKSLSFCAAFIESIPLKSKLLIHLSMKSIPLHRCVQQARRVAAARPRVGELAANLQTSTAAHIKGLHRHHSRSAAQHLILHTSYFARLMLSTGAIYKARSVP